MQCYKNSQQNTFLLKEVSNLEILKITNKDINL